MLLFIWLVVLIAATVLYLKQVYSKFKRNGVKGPTPIPLLGSTFTMFLRKEHMVNYSQRMYNKYPDERFFGIFEFLRPMVVIRDVELIKLITVKDFEHFLDHRTMVDSKTDPIFGRNLFALKGQEWKDMRSTLSPAFTSSKIRLMVPFMMEVGNQMVDSLKKQIKESNVKNIDIDVKDLTTRYANDVIASCAFGLKIDSMAEKDNHFFKIGKVITNFNVRMLLKMFMSMYIPLVTKTLNIKLLPEWTTSLLKNIILGSMDEREKNNIIRPDMIHLLMQAKKGKLQHEDKTIKDVDAGFATVEESAVGTKIVNRVWSDNDLVAQCVLFFLAGFETVSTGMSFALHELACNPDVQDKLAAEIKENDIKNNGKFDFNSIQNMMYMDMVVSEVLRLWTPAGLMDRTCNKDYNLGKPNSKAAQDYIIRKGDALQLPAWAIHRDPKYFPNPTKFDPERFSEENKHDIQPFTYFPFGLGPRNCIGSRFALCEVKVMLYQLLQHFELSPCEKTCLPPELVTDRFNVCLIGGHWVRLQIRE